MFKMHVVCIHDSFCFLNFLVFDHVYQIHVWVIFLYFWNMVLYIYICDNTYTASGYWLSSEDPIVSFYTQLSGHFTSQTKNKKQINRRKEEKTNKDSRQKKARTVAFLAQCVYIWLLLDPLWKSSKCWLIPPPGSWSLLGHCFHCFHAAFWPFSPGSLCPIMRLLDCWLLQPQVQAVNWPTSLILATPTFGLVGLCKHSSLCGLRAKIDSQRQIFKTIWRYPKDAEYKILSLATHPRKHTQTYTHTSIYIYIHIHIWMCISVPHFNRMIYIYIYIYIYIRKSMTFFIKNHLNTFLKIVIYIALNTKTICCAM